jgi:hypothetical protein
MVVNKSKMFNGTDVADLLEYQIEQTHGLVWDIVLIGFFIVVFGILAKRNFEMPIAVFTAATLTLLFSVLLIAGGEAIDIMLLSERSFIIVVIVWIAALINFKYNKVEND